MGNRSDMWMKFSPFQCSLSLFFFFFQIASVVKTLTSNSHLNRKDINLGIKF